METVDPPAPATAPPPLPPTLPPPISRFNWWMHLVVLGSYPVLMGLMGWLLSGDREGAVLPTDPLALMFVVLVELAIFTAFYGISIWFSKAGRGELLIPWRGGFRPWWRGAGYSVALRVAVAVVTIAVVAVYVWVTGVGLESLKDFRPKVEALVDMNAIADDPVYFWLNLTLISFVVAGLREELWRAGVLAAMRRLWPGRFGSIGGGVLASAIIAVSFGLGHINQGWVGVGLTTVLGFGLGIIMVVHRSIWDAVIAHGFFNATSFAMLHWMMKHHPEALGM